MRAHFFMTSVPVTFGKKIAVIVCKLYIRKGIALHKCLLQRANNKRLGAKSTLRGAHKTAGKVYNVNMNM